MLRPPISAVTALAVGLFGLSAPGASAQNAVDRQVPTSMGQLQLSFAPIVKRVAPAVTGRVLEIRTGSGLSQTLYSLKNVQQVIRVVPSAKGKRVSE